MIGKIEYLEKYSVAPPPSRDYYGLKILQDELILYIWKISHGPHKTPISRIIKFVEFSQDKTLQDFIGRFFGEHFVNYIQKLAEGKGNTLLTLPRSSIRKIVEFLHFKDIVNLSSLSRIANVVFNDNFIWETLYKRHKRFNISKKEIEYAMAYGWKQTFKDQQIPFSAELRKITGSTIKNEHLKMKNGLSRSMSGPLKTLPKVSNSSVSNEIVRPLQITQKNAQTNLIKSLKNNKVNDDTIKTNRNDKKINVNVKKINKTNKTNKTSNTKKDKSTKNDEVRESFSDSMSIAGQQNSSTNKRNTKSVVTTVKTINGNLHITEKDKFFGDTKKNNVINKNTMNKTNNGVSSNSQSIKNKTLSKNNKTKTKKLMESNSTILNTDKSFINESAVMKNENFELAYLIEESLKRIRSPRTVFDYDYSYLEDAKTLTDSTKKNKTMNTMKDIKHDRINKKLDRLSENSDSMTTLSNNSIENMKLNESDRSTNKISTKEKNTLFDKKIIVDRNEMLEPVTDLNENSPKISPKIIDETDTKYCIPKGALNSIDIMKSLRSSNPMIRSTALSGKNLPTTATNRFALRKSFNELRKDRIMQDN